MAILNMGRKDDMFRVMRGARFAIAIPIVLAVSTAGCNSTSSSVPTPKPMAVSSATFANGTTVPITMVFNGAVSSGVCTGGNQSPQLSWSNVPAGTKSFAVVMFDATANFFHWGMYNIPPGTTSLAANAGIVGSTAGTQVFNDFGNQRYDGPCPPPGLAHDYDITVYAVDTTLTLTSNPGLNPVNGTTLLGALIGHTLGSATITGLYSR
jgi:Raf kinase inhibitor-like YbhB/YbcL family protein